MSTINGGLFSSNSGKWNTPPSLLERLCIAFGWAID
jgi:hypothetical protein